MASEQARLYDSVIEDVVNAVRETFLDDGVDEQILIELKETWKKKLNDAKVIPDETPKATDDSLSSATSGSSGANSSAKSKDAKNSTGSKKSSKKNEQKQQQQQLEPQTKSVSNSRTTGASSAHSVFGSEPLSSNSTVPLPTPSIQTNLPPHTSNSSISSMYSDDRQQPQRTQVIQPPIRTAAHYGALSGPASEAQSALPDGIQIPHLMQPGSMAGHAPPGMLSFAQPLPHSSVLHPTANSLANHRAQQNVHPETLQQVDGVNDDSSEDDDDDDEDDEDIAEEEEHYRDDDIDDLDDHGENEEGADGEGDEEPLNSEDDVSEEDDPAELFETENVVVCQYDKITRARNKWKFHLKDGIMNLKGKDYVFQRMVGDAEW